MTFLECCRQLGIEDYAERIFNSSSTGELHYLSFYFNLAEMKDDLSWFRPWFLTAVEYAEENWDRPESVFQHMDRFLSNSAASVRSGSNEGKQCPHLGDK